MRRGKDDEFSFRNQEEKKEDKADRHFGILDIREVTSGPKR